MQLTSIETTRPTNVGLSSVTSGYYTKKIPTYDGFLSTYSKHRVQVKTVRDIQDAVVEAGSAGLRVRTAGAGQSWVPYLLNADVSLDVTSLNRIHGIDRVRKTITVDAGATLGDVTRALGSRGLALPSLSFMEKATIGGIVSTATHGTSHRWGTLSDFVRSIDFVTASGRIKSFGPDSPPDEMAAARVAVGMLGVITRVELQAVDMPWVRYDKLRMDLTGFLKDLPQIQAHYDHVWVHWELGSDAIEVDCLEVSPGRRNRFYEYVDDQSRCWTPLPFPARLLNTRCRRAARTLLHAARSTTSIMAKRATPQRAQDEVRISMQYGVPAGEIETFVAAIKASGVAEQYRGRDMEIKFLAGSDGSFLGPNADRPSALFNVFWLVPQSQKHEVLGAFETLMRSMNARPHWGKYHSSPDVGYMRRVFPKWNDFEHVRERMDPSGMFTAFDNHH